MSGTGASYPISGNAELLLSEMNTLFGQLGSGSPMFWEKMGDLVFRDSVTQGLRYPKGYYPLTVADGMIFRFKGNTEERNFESIAGKILIGPLQAERIDGPAVPFDAVSPTADPGGEIEAATRTALKPWADFLPAYLAISALVNGKLPGTNPDGSARPALSVYTDGSAFFATDHKVNKLKGPVTFRNTRTLGAAFSEAGWATILDDIAQVPEVDGTILPNAFTSAAPEIIVPTHGQWRRYAHVLGGGTLPSSMLINDGNNAAITSVYVGGAILTVNPYFYTLASDKAAVVKRAFVKTRSARKALIFREELAPRIGTFDHRSKDNTAGVYIEASATVGFGEPRALYEIIEP